MIVELKSDRGPYAKGEKVSLSDDRARLLIAQGAARAVSSTGADGLKGQPARSVIHK